MENIYNKGNVVDNGDNDCLISLVNLVAAHMICPAISLIRAVGISLLLSSAWLNVSLEFCHSNIVLFVWS